MPHARVPLGWIKWGCRRALQAIAPKRRVALTRIGRWTFKGEMTDDSAKPETTQAPTQAPTEAPPKPLSPAAKRTLVEAAQRRAERDSKATPEPKEVGGPKGPEPTRYGDWEKKGLTSDF
jgi:hypothetical protein